MPQLPGTVEVWEWEVVRASDFCLAGVSLQGGGGLALFWTTPLWGPLMPMILVSPSDNRCGFGGEDSASS